MYQKEDMFAAIYKALGEGVAKLIKYGAAFTVLIGCVAGLIWALFYVVKEQAQEKVEWKREIHDVRIECSNQINLLQTKIYECNEQRASLAGRVAALEAIVKKKR